MYYCYFVIQTSAIFHYFVIYAILYFTHQFNVNKLNCNCKYTTDQIFPYSTFLTLNEFFFNTI